MSDYDEMEREIRKRVEKKLERRNEFYTHLAAFVIINSILWTIWAFSGTAFPWPIFVTGGWGIGLFADWQEFYNEVGGGSERRDRMIQREIEREREMLYGRGTGKRKNDDADLWIQDDEDEQQSYR